MSANVVFSRLYHWVRGDWRPNKPGKVYWLVSSRPSSLGGYIANLCGTYEHSGGKISPNTAERHDNIPMDQLEEISYDVER